MILLSGSLVLPFASTWHIFHSPVLGTCIVCRLLFWWDYVYLGQLCLSKKCSLFFSSSFYYYYYYYYYYYCIILPSDINSIQDWPTANCTKIKNTSKTRVICLRLKTKCSSLYLYIIGLYNNAYGHYQRPWGVKIQFKIAFPRTCVLHFLPIRKNVGFNTSYNQVILCSWQFIDVVLSSSQTDPHFSTPQLYGTP